MADINKQTNVTVSLDIDDLKAVSVSPRGYNPSLTFNLRDNTTIEINFRGEGSGIENAFDNLLNCILNAAVKADPTQRYGSGHHYTSEAIRITVAQVHAMMKREDIEETLKAIDN